MVRSVKGLVLNVKNFFGIGHIGTIKFLVCEICGLY